jgi:hypothetical protein
MCAKCQAQCASANRPKFLKFSEYLAGGFRIMRRAERTETARIPLSNFNGVSDCGRLRGLLTKWG